MAKDKNGASLKVGDRVKTVSTMGVRPNISARGKITLIDGEYIYVYSPLHRINIQRYGCELEKLG